MKLKYAFTFLTIALIFLSRHHLRDLSEVARTYATHYPYIESHGDVLYKYPQPEGQDPVRSAEEAPKIIHQIFLQEGRQSTFSKYSAGLESCKQMHPDWEHKLWTDDNATAFISENYPAIAPHYTGYKQSIQRANILRYALLDHYGGVYLDLDVTCLQPLDNLLHVPWITPGAYPAGVNNAFILSRKHHKFLQELLSKVPSRDIKWPLPYVENMLSTGCMYFSSRFMAYARWMTSFDSVAPEDKMYVLADTNGEMEPHMLRGAVTTPLFKHAGASSWHGWDAAMIVLIGKHYVYFAVILLSFIGGFAYAIYSLTRKAPRRPSGTWMSLVSRRSTDKLQDEERLLVGKEG